MLVIRNVQTRSRDDPQYGWLERERCKASGLSIGFEVDSDILKVAGYGGRRPPHKRGVGGGGLMPPAGYRGRALLGVQGVKPPRQNEFDFPYLF